MTILQDMCHLVSCPADLWMATVLDPELSLLTDQLLEDLSSLVGEPEPRPYVDALQSAAACRFQLSSFKCNKTMQEVPEDRGPGFPHP